jgi:hypothetical protein
MAKAGAFGVPPRSIARLAAPVGVAGFLLMIAPAAAEDLCGGLRQVMAHAVHNFATLKIAGERGRPGADPAQTLFADGNRCEVRETPHVVEYRCRMTPADAPSAETRVTFRRDVRRLRRCFPGQLPRGDGDFTGAVEWTGAVIWEPKPGLRAAVVYVTADETALVADRGEDPHEEPNAAWIVVEKKKP